MDFELSQEHTMFQKAMRSFVEKEITPLVEEAEEKEITPIELFPKLGELGYLCPGYPEELGGGGLGKTGDCIQAEEIAKVSSGICAGIMVTSGLATTALMKHGSDEQKQKYLVPAIRGEKVAAFGLTEPNVGSDAAAIETTAKRDGEHYIINGTKIFITNGPICSFVTLAVSTDRSRGAKGITTIIVELDTPGLSWTKLRKLGLHSSSTAEIVFEDCRVPAENLIGVEGEGFKYMLESLASGRISHSARGVGLAQAALEDSLNYAKERIQFGQPIGKFQSIAFKLARMATDIEAARWLLYRTAWLYDQGNECRKEAAMTKYFTAEVCVRTAEEAMRIHAGAGYLAESKIHRYFRDAILLPITEGTNEIQQLVISRELGL